MLTKLIKLLGNDIDIEIADFCLEKSKDLITTYCNLREVPTKLENICISIAIDIFRDSHYGRPQVPVSVKSITVGGTKTSYGDDLKTNGTSDMSFLKPYISQLNAYKKLRGWG